MADEEGSLSRGNIVKITQGAKISENYFQVLKVHPPTVSNGQTKYRITIHDSEKFIDAILPTNLNGLMRDSGIIEGTVLQMDEYALNTIQGNHVLIVQKIEVLQKDCEQLGENLQPVSPASKPASSAKGFGNRSSGFGNQNFGGRSAGFGGQNTGFGQNTNSYSKAGTVDNNEYQLVNQLSPFQKDFKIKVRVTRKGNIREWNNDRGSGKLFSLDFLDMQGGEIQATAFKEICDKLYPMFEEGKVYVVSKGRIKVANKRYTHINNDYSIDLNNDTEVTFVGEDKSISSMRYEFKTLNLLNELEDKTYIDCCGVVDHVGEPQTFTSKRTNKELTKRVFRICDQSGSAVECTLWGEEATKFDAGSLHHVICCKAARVSEFNGKSLSVNKYAVDPEGIKEVEDLLKWWQTDGSSSKFTSLTQSRGGGRNEPPITIAEMEQKGFGSKPDQADFFNLKCTVERVNQDKENNKFPWYKALPADEAGADTPAYKVTEDEGGQGWFCEKTGKTYSKYDCRYTLRFMASDHTGSSWFNAFDEAGKIIMGMAAGDIEKLVDGGDDAAYSKVFSDAQQKTWNLRIKARQDTWQDEARRRLDVLGATAIDFEEDSKHMMVKIKELMGTAA